MAKISAIFCGIVLGKLEIRHAHIFVTEAEKQVKVLRYIGHI